MHARLDVASLFGVSARRWPERVALIADGAATTYAALDERIGRLASGLRSLGVEAGDRVVMLLPNGARFIETWWAAVAAGAVIVPLNARCAPEELKRFIEDCAPRVIVTDGAHLAMIEASRAGTPALRAAVVSTDGAARGARGGEDLVAASSPLAHAPQDLSAPCAIYYTAGTTGVSKGVVRSHLSVVWGLSMIAQRMTPEDVLLGRAPMAHAGGSLTGPFAVLVAGGTLVIPERTDPESLLDLVQRYRVSRFYVHPVLSAKALFGALDRGRYDLGSVRLLQWTAGSMPEAIRGEIFRRFPGVPLEVTYGMTEVSNIATYRYDDGPTGKPAHCVGYAWPGSEIGIVDRNGALVSDGGEGEVVVRSPTAMTGYWNAPETTATVTRGGWVHTGDIGCLDADGALLLTGRLKDAINTAGMTVHAAEVEHAISAHADVVDAAVFGLPDARWEEAVTAVVACRSSSRLSEEELLDHCRAHLSSYKIPKRVYIVSELPRNSSNKVDKRALRARFATAGPTAD
jgi:acyl-CoA synthetase (AMP-forming)/AMP-acid ligase II